MGALIDYDLLSDRLAHFSAEQNWGSFHVPKNLAMALVVEAAEVVEHFQWLTTEESACADDVALELADVLFYLIMLADSLEIDLDLAAANKLRINRTRFAVTSEVQNG